MEPLELPAGKYRVYKTREYTIYYLLDESVEIGREPERKITSGGHEFYFFKGVIVIKPVSSTSRARGAPSV
jgi:hypothetical protein